MPLIKRWEHPSKGPSRNNKSKAASARLRQLKKRTKMQLRRLKAKEPSFFAPFTRFVNKHHLLGFQLLMQPSRKTSNASHLRQRIYWGFEWQNKGKSSNIHFLNCHMYVSARYFFIFQKTGPFSTHFSGHFYHSSFPDLSS
jgi:hypothetical protein